MFYGSDSVLLPSKNDLTKINYFFMLFNTVERVSYFMAIRFFYQSFPSMWQNDNSLRDLSIEGLLDGSKMNVVNLICL